uniref:APC regulator of WNT signaling pathway 2 n=1 Tax=Salarias fasciatus TaxID=181472 RepID=A0A672G473_SALFA
VAMATASYDQLAHQVEALRQENSSLRRELNHNVQHLSKLESETSGMKEALKQLQSKLEQEAGSLASSGRSDVLHQLKAACWLMLRANSYMLTVSSNRELLLGETDRDERERRWYFSQLEALTQRLAQLPRIDAFSLQMDLIRQQLACEAQQLRAAMERRFGSQHALQRAQVRAARLEQLEKELQEYFFYIFTCIYSFPTTSCLLCGPAPSPSSGPAPLQVEAVLWLLSLLAGRDPEDLSRTLLALSSSQDSCLALRRSGCVPLLVQILHGDAGDGPAPAVSREAKSRAAAALHNVVCSQADEGQGRREARVLLLLEQIRTHCDSGWDWLEERRQRGDAGGRGAPEPLDPQLVQATCALMKLSFEEEYRRAMNELGGLQAVADLIQLDQELYGAPGDPVNLSLRRYAGMAVTNLTFGDVANKATLCSRAAPLQALVRQLESDSEELQQVVSSILRNLSWRAPVSSRRLLRDVGCVAALTACALRATKESTLKSVLSALWNLSAHSAENKAALCAVDGALAFLVSTLTYRCQTNSLAIIESGGGILRNVASLVATREDYRRILRAHACLPALLAHLRSPSLTIVSNACGALMHLSSSPAPASSLSPAPSPDQLLLLELGAAAMLRNLVHSRHRAIAAGSAAALRNLLSVSPAHFSMTSPSPTATATPSLLVRKQKALEAELNYASDSGCFDDEEPANASSIQASHANANASATANANETLQKYSVENTPICFSRCSSLSSLSSDSDSAPSDDVVQDTPLVMSRCSSVSSLGSFGSPSIASSIISDNSADDALLDGNLSPSDLPDSPGQTAPPSRCRTPGIEPSTTATTTTTTTTDASIISEIKLALPPDLDSGRIFTTGNFSCASSLSALPVHEHYVQKEVELKLTPLHASANANANSDEDIEILKECINSAMPVSDARRLRELRAFALARRAAATQRLLARSKELSKLLLLPVVEDSRKYDDLSSISDAESEKRRKKWKKTNANANSASKARELASSSAESEDDLLQRCITSAMPKQRRKKPAKFSKALLAEDSDESLTSTDWRAIREGAARVVDGLLAAKPDTDDETETEEVMSLASSFTPKNRKWSSGGGGASKPLDFAARRPRGASIPVVLRGRTVIYTPPRRDSPPSQVPLASQRSKSLHRLDAASMLTLAPRSATPPPPRSSSSDDSGGKAQKSPVRIPFMRRQQKPVPSPLAAANANNVARLPPRQLTFIKEPRASKAAAAAQARRTGSDEPRKLALARAPLAKAPLPRQRDNASAAFRRHASSPSIASPRSTSSDSSAKTSASGSARLKDAAAWRRARGDKLTASAASLSPQRRQTSDATVQTEETFRSPSKAARVTPFNYTPRNANANVSTASVSGVSVSDKKKKLEAC